jgi:hypothetical protein
MGVKGLIGTAAKIFEYIATGKPIIHFYFDSFDTNNEYYKKYRNSLLINLNDDAQENADKINLFLSQPIKIIEWNDLEKMFPMNIAKYTVDLILESLNKGEN